MLTLKIIDKRGFAACQAAAKEALNEKYRGVIVRPDGTVVGAQGHFVVVCKNCVESFDGAAIQIRAYMLKKPQYAGKQDVTLNIASTGTVTISGYKRILSHGFTMPLAPFDEKALDGELTTVQRSKDVAFNYEYLALIAKILCTTYEVVYFEVRGGNREPYNIWFNEEHTGAKMYLLPVYY